MIFSIRFEGEMPEPEIVQAAFIWLAKYATEFPEDSTEYTVIIGLDTEAPTYNGNPPGWAICGDGLSEYMYHDPRNAGSYCNFMSSEAIYWEAHQS